MFKGFESRESKVDAKVEKTEASNLDTESKLKLSDRVKAFFDKSKGIEKEKTSEQSSEKTEMNKRELSDFEKRIRVDPKDLKYRPDPNTMKKRDSGNNGNNEGYERTRAGDAYFRRFHEYDNSYKDNKSNKDHKDGGEER